MRKPFKKAFYFNIFKHDEGLCVHFLILDSGQGARHLSYYIELCFDI